MSMIDEASLRQAFNAELDDFHGFLNEWFPGQCPQSEELFLNRHAGHLADDFEIILPGGSILDRAGLVDYIRSIYGKNVGFRKQIRNVRMRPLTCDDCLLVNYEEWQKNATNTEPPNHARMISAVLAIVSSDPIRFQWRLIHETMMSAETWETDPFDF